MFNFGHIVCRRVSSREIYFNMGEVCQKIGRLRARFLSRGPILPLVAFPFHPSKQVQAV